MTINEALNKAAEAYGAGNIEVAKKLFGSIIEIEPNNSDANHNMGLILIKSGDLEESLPFFKTALETNFSVAQYWFSYINALFNVGRFTQASELLATAKDKGCKGPAFDDLETKLSSKEVKLELEIRIQRLQKLDEDGPYAYLAPFGIGNAHREQGKLEEAIEAYNKALAIKPDYAEAYNNMGITLKEQGKLEEAIEAFNKALAIKPDYVEVYNHIGITLQEQGKLEEAIEAYKKNSSQESQTSLLRCLYEQDKQADFYNQLDYLISQGENNAVIGTYISQSQIKYGINRANPFCNEPLKYVLHTNLADHCDFENIFVKGATELLSEDMVQNRQQSLLTNGTQTTGNVFNQIGDFGDRIQSILRSELENYRMHFNDSQEGLIKSWPSDYEINGWLVSMKSGGKLAAHMHDRGWISGSVYINVPPKVNNDSGNLVVSLGSEKDIQSIDVVTGSLCLFPSSLLHYTIPFEADENRIVLAFDIIPK